MTYEPDEQMLEVAAGYIEPPKSDGVVKLLWEIVYLLEHIRMDLSEMKR